MSRELVSFCNIVANIRNDLFLLQELTVEKVGYNTPQHSVVRIMPNVISQMVSYMLYSYEAGLIRRDS